MIHRNPGRMLSHERIREHDNRRWPASRPSFPPGRRLCIRPPDPEVSSFSRSQLHSALASGNSR